MENGLSRMQIEKLYLPPQGDFSIVDVPKMKMLMVDGAGDPSAPPFAHAMQWIFAVVYPIKRVAKERMGKNFIEPPLEALWWADDIADFIAGRRDKLKWRLMVSATPEWITQELFADAVSQASARLGKAPKTLRLGDFDEGQSVQIMYVGNPAEQCERMSSLHQEYLPAHGLVCNGPHHEIYLTDARRVAPEKQKTVLRQPVKTAPKAARQARRAEK